MIQSHSATCPLCCPHHQHWLRLVTWIYFLPWCLSGLTLVPAPELNPRNPLDDPLPPCCLPTLLSPSLLTLSSTQDSPALLVPHISWAPLSLLTPSSFPALPRVSSPPAQFCEMDPLVSHRAFRPMTPPRPVSSAVVSHHSGSTGLPCPSGSTCLLAVPQPSTPSASLCSAFPLAPRLGPHSH